MAVPNITTKNGSGYKMIRKILICCFITLLVIAGGIIFYYVWGIHIIAKVEGIKNEKLVMEYAQEKYGKEFIITYKLAGHTDFLNGRMPDYFTLRESNSDGFPFEIVYDNRICDYYPLYHMGYLIKRHIDETILKQVSSEYTASCSVVIYDIPDERLEEVHYETIEDIANIYNKSVEYNIIICSKEQIIIEEEMDWIYSLFTELAKISHEFHINLGFAKEEYFKSWVDRFENNVDNGYGAEGFKEQLYGNLRIGEDTEDDIIWTKDKLKGIFKYY